MKFKPVRRKIWIDVKKMPGDFRDISDFFLSADNQGEAFEKLKKDFPNQIRFWTLEPLSNFEVYLVVRRQDCSNFPKPGDLIKKKQKRYIQASSLRVAYQKLKERYPNLWQGWTLVFQGRTS